MAEYVTVQQLTAAIAELEGEINALLSGLEVLRPVQGDYITNQEAVDLINNTIDVWHDLLWDTLMKVTHLVDDINGEIVYDNLVNKLEYLKETKRLIREAIGPRMPDDTRFRDYPDYIEGGGGGPGVIIPLVINGPGVYNKETYICDGFDPVTAGGYPTVITIDGVNRNEIPFNVVVEVTQ